VPLAGEDRVKLQSLQEWITGDLVALEAEVDRLLQSDDPMVQEICDHLSQGKGKRFRPTLLLLTAKHGPRSEADAVFAAACIEIVHLATLVHDDFIDSAETRRGLPTVNVKWSPAAALIMGDWLYSKVFALLCQRGMFDAMRIIGTTTHLMSLAEMMQLEFHRKLDLSEEDYLTVIQRKTGSLIEASCEIGALLHPGLAPHAAAFAEYGRQVGRAFQITDDILDYLADDRQLGKPVGGDWKEGRITLPFIAAWRDASAAERRDLEQAVAESADPAALWSDVRAFVQRHDGVEFAYERAHHYGSLAREAIKSVHVDPQREILSTAAEYVLGRLH
jgi:geranylgeranyl pyrophosphate synthase